MIIIIIFIFCETQSLKELLFYPQADVKVQILSLMASHQLFFLWILVFVEVLAVPFRCYWPQDTKKHFYQQIFAKFMYFRFNFL